MTTEVIPRHGNALTRSSASCARPRREHRVTAGDAPTRPRDTPPEAHVRGFEALPFQMHVVTPATAPGRCGGGRTTMETTVVDVPERGRFEVRVGEQVVGLARYHAENGPMALRAP